LLENIQNRKLFGDTPELQHQRYHVIYQLNRMARDLFGISFNDLNVINTLVINRRIYLDEVANASISQRVSFLSPQPDDSAQLEVFLPQQPDFLDVQLLQEAAAKSHGVCKLSLPTFGRSGTGFLVTQNLILTNYHILCEHADEDPMANAREVRVRFGFFHSNDLLDSTEPALSLETDRPIVAMSSVQELDFVLLRLDDTVHPEKLTSRSPLRLSPLRPLKRSALHILQHPNGEAMKLAIGTNGVIGVHDERYIQYVTQTKNGSSGAPCFSSSWEVVALHRASHARTFGSIREGVLMNAIYPNIAMFL
jgi:V8-like Glu-specific endopeptidase